jgi:hypothetical protein
MERKILCVFVLLLWILSGSAADAKVLPRVFHNHCGEIMVDFLAFTEEFGRIFRGANIGGEKRQYALFFIGDNKRNSAEICYRLIGSEPAPFDDPASVIGTICEIKLPFESREEKNKAARYASRITLITLFIYEQYQDFSRVVFPSALPKKSIYRRGIKKERKNF